MKPTPPPQQFTMDRNDVPDYYCGRLIFYDDSEAMHYVVYDGLKKVRFATRTAAEKFCIEKAYEIQTEAFGEISRAFHHLTRASIVLRQLNLKYPMDERVQLESISVNARRMADALDTILAKYIPK